MLEAGAEALLLLEPDGTTALEGALELGVSVEETADEATGLEWVMGLTEVAELFSAALELEP